jgi:hypothetical protein
VAVKAEELEAVVRTLEREAADAQMQISALQQQLEEGAAKEQESREQLDQAYYEVSKMRDELQMLTARLTARDQALQQHVQVGAAGLGSRHHRGGGLRSTSRGVLLCCMRHGAWGRATQPACTNQLEVLQLSCGGSGVLGEPALLLHWLVLDLVSMCHHTPITVRGTCPHCWEQRQRRLAHLRIWDGSPH